jgi:hypothetical protein
MKTVDDFEWLFWFAVIFIIGAALMGWVVGWLADRPRRK